MDVVVFQALLLGVIEGLTEFLPISSTGHLILARDMLGFRGPPGIVFEVVIQLGAILAICVAYAGRLAGVAIRLPTDPGARRFVVAVVLAFLPAAAIGAAAHDLVEEVLFDPVVVCLALILGGVAILVIERRVPEGRVRSVEQIGPGLALGIGLAQCVALIPGVSRSGASILGAVLMGVERRAAAEFSFFVAIPTMLGASVYTLYKSRDSLSTDGLSLVVLGFAAAFVVALAVVRPLVRFVGRHGFAPFGWYRIVFGLVMLVLFQAYG